MTSHPASIVLHLQAPPEVDKGELLVANGDVQMNFAHRGGNWYWVIDGVRIRAS